MHDNQPAVEFDAQQASYTPTEVAAYGLQAIEQVRSSAERAIGIGAPGLRDYFAPMRPGQVAGIVGQTSHYKSGLLHYIEHQAAKQLTTQHRTDEAIVHISLEESVEEQSFLELARSSGENAGRLANGDVKDWDRLIKRSYDVAGIPIYRVGDSLVRSEDIPKLYLSNILRSVQWLVREYKIKLALIGLDYLQALPLDPELRNFDYDQARRLQVRTDAYRMREIASRFGCPVVVACQAKQTLGNLLASKGPPLLIPGMYDVNESSDIAQRFDRLLGVWLPARSYPVGTRLRIGNMELPITDNLLLVKVNKQRGGYPAGRAFLFNIDYENNDLQLVRTVESNQ